MRSGSCTNAGPPSGPGHRVRRLSMTLRCTALRSPKVLLVDDLQLNRVVLGRMLSKMGFEVLEARDGVEAVELFRGHQLACVLLDLQMPVMDGWQTAQELRLWEDAQQLSRTPIVACTALDLHEQWRKEGTVTDSAISCGIDELLGKMPTMSQLMSVLSKYVAGLQAAVTVVTAAVPLPAATATAAAAPAQLPPQAALAGAQSL